MIQDITMIPGFPEVMQHITAVSDIIDLCYNNEAKLCFTISFRDDTFINVSKPYTPANRGFSYEVIKLLHDRVLEYLEDVKHPRATKLPEETGTLVSGRRKTTCTGTY